MPLDIHVLQFSDDLRNAVRSLLGLLRDQLATALPVRPVQGPETLNVVGGSVSQVVYHPRPLFEGMTRITVYPSSSPKPDLIVIEATSGDGQWSEIWRSDVPWNAVKKAG